MTKKVFAIIITFLMIVFTSSIIFAENNETMGGEWNDSVEKTQNTMQNIGNGVESAVDGVMNMGRNVVNGITDPTTDNPAYTNDTAGVTTMQNGNNDNNTDFTGTTTANNDYTATRTATNLDTTNTSLFGLSDTAWTWIVMIITAAVIVSLIYYYAAQFENTTSINNRNDE